MKENVLKSLDMMWKGMVAIFIVMCVIFLFIVLMNAVTSYRNRRRHRVEHGEAGGLPEEKDIEQR